MRKIEDEELAEEYIAKVIKHKMAVHDIFEKEKVEHELKQAFLAGLKAGRPEWHKVADGDLPKGDDSFGETSIHRKIYLKDRYGNLYTGNYYPKDKCHPRDCFAVEFLDWGLQGANFCEKEQILEWCEIPKYTEE